MIDYSKLARSVVHYKNRGFVPIDAPWTVSKGTTHITKPAEYIDHELMHNGKVLVGSAEQSFLYMMIKGFLLPGRYQAITPCFRDESFDLMHRKYFMKNELIDTETVNKNTMDSMIIAARDFFEHYLPASNLFIEQTDDTSEAFDINCKFGDYCFELGSYGIRRHMYLEWVFGTGCAEPRLTNVIDTYNKWATTTGK